MKGGLPRSCAFVRIRPIFEDISSLSPLCGEVLNAAAELGLPVIADEVYAGMSFSRHAMFLCFHPSLGPYLEHFRAF